MSKKKIAGDPTPLSPIAVEKSSDYELMDDYVAGSWYPSAAEVVAKHKATGTFWQAVYAVREDDSDADMSATWHQVVPKKVTITQYERV